MRKSRRKLLATALATGTALVSGAVVGSDAEAATAASSTTVAKSTTRQCRIPDSTFVFTYDIRYTVRGAGVRVDGVKVTDAASRHWMRAAMIDTYWEGDWYGDGNASWSNGITRYPYVGVTYFGGSSATGYRNGNASHPIKVRVILKAYTKAGTVTPACTAWTDITA